MKDAYEVLRDKEAELARIRHEITSLKIVAPLLTEEVVSDINAKSQNPEQDDSDPEHHPEATGTDGMFSFTSTERPKIWNVLKRGK